MEIGKPDECRVLATEFKSELPPCGNICVASVFPSYRSTRGEPRGCWVAHTALTVIECISLMQRLGRAFDKRGINRRLIEEAALLHDVGKLSKLYTLGKGYVQHNVLSWAVALSVCKDLEVPTSILIHHEAMHWKDLYGERLPLQRLQRSFDMRPVVRGFSLHEKYMEALEALKAVLKVLKMESIASTLEGLMESREYKADLSEVNRCLRWGDHLKRALMLYWLLYLADNRAASARDGLNAYWLSRLRELSKYSEDPSELADAILERAKRPDLSLTAIPKPRVIGCR